MSDRQGMTVSEWHQVTADGDGAPHRELLDGEQIVSAPLSAAGAECVIRIHRVVEAAVGYRALTQMHLPVVLDERSEPRPDVSVVGRPTDDGSSDLLLVVEVSDTSHSLIYNRGRKAAYYARCGVPECWVVDLSSNQVIVHSVPASGGYREIRNLRPGSSIDLVAIPDSAVAVSDLLDA